MQIRERGKHGRVTIMNSEILYGENIHRGANAEQWVSKGCKKVPWRTNHLLLTRHTCSCLVLCCLTIEATNKQILKKNKNSGPNMIWI
jgi:hypothetical protein